MTDDFPTINELLPEVNSFFNQGDISGPIDYLIENLPFHAKLFVVGGSIRNVFIRKIHGVSPITRDIDLFIANVEEGFYLDDKFQGQKFKKTELGGIRWEPMLYGPAFDICMLPDFVIIKKARLAPTLENLLRTIDFTANAVVFDLKTRQLHQTKCIKAVCNRVLDFNTLVRLNKVMLVYRILVIRFKTGFYLAEQVFSFVKQCVDLNTLVALRKVLISKQGKDTACMIMDDYNRIAGYRDYSEYLRSVSKTSGRAGPIFQ